MKIETAGDIARALTPLVEQMEVASHPDTLSDRLAKALEPFGTNGPWKYAPTSERDKVTRDVTDTHHTAAGEAVFVVEQEAMEADRWLKGLEAETQEPVSPVTAWQRARSQVGVLPPLEVQNLSILQELQIARYDRTLADARPSVVSAAYAAALKRPFEQDACNLIRWVEERHGTGWSGRGVEGDTTEALAAQALNTAIRDARLARIPADVQAARAVIAGALASADRVKATRRVRAQRPALWRVA